MREKINWGVMRWGFLVFLVMFFLLASVAALYILWFLARHSTVLYGFLLLGFFFVFWLLRLYMRLGFAFRNRSFQYIFKSFFLWLLRRLKTLFTLGTFLLCLLSFFLGSWILGSFWLLVYFVFLFLRIPHVASR